MNRLAIVAAALICSVAPSIAQDMPELPDAQKTPGAVLETIPDAHTASCLADLVGGDIAEGDTVTLEMICTPGYSKCIRNVNTTVKRSVYASYGLDGNHTGYCDSKQGCEIDHLISLELGGANDEKNLWPQPYQGEAMNAHVKDQLENWLHHAVCTGQMALKDAQQEISSNWIESFRKHVGDTVARR